MSRSKTTVQLADEQRTARLEDARTERIGQAPPGRLVLGRYRLGERLGAGGFGVVWRATDERLEREVAVKAISHGGEAAEDARVQREAVAAARLNHPGIVALYELGTDDHAAYLVSELVDGATLADLGREGAVSDRDVARIGVALCDALDHAHARGVVHRDVKPGNVMVVAEPAAGAGFAKLTDFGIARIASGDSLTATGDIVGTLAYMAPEQAEGREVGPEADVYSLALTLYEAWSGTNPVRGSSPAATARQVGAPLPPLRRQRRDLPPALCEVVDAALDPDPGYRPPLSELREVFADSQERLSDQGGLVEPATIQRFGLTAVTRRGTLLTRVLGRGRDELPPPIVVPGEEASPVVEAVTAGRPWWHQIAERVAAGVAAGILVAVGIGLGPEPSFAVGTAALVAAGAVALLPRVGWVLAAMAVCAWLASPEGGQEGTALVLTAALIPIPLLLPFAGRLWSAPAIAPLLGAIGLAPLFVAAAAWLGRTAWQRGALALAGLLWLRFAEVLTGSDLLYGSAPPAPPRAGWQGSVVDAARDAIEPIFTSADVVLTVAWVGAAVALPLLARAWRRPALP